MPPEDQPSPAATIERIRVLRDGVQAFPAMLELIAQAREEVLFENFIFAGDRTGRMFADALAAAARRGVAVRVLYDPVGTWMVKGGSIAGLLRREGVQARPFRPLSPLAPWTLWRLRHRDHRKTLTVDSTNCVVGGLCISDNWSPPSQGGQGWRDTALQVRGAVAPQVREAFWDMWRDGRADATRGRLPALAGALPPSAWVLCDHPGAERVEHAYAWLARHAGSSLDIADAYLVMPRPVVAELRAAARRGVRVRILTPHHNNHAVAAAAARALYQPLLDAGIELHEWRGSMLHAKTAVMDGRISLVGSSNLDPLSMRRNFELNLVVLDPATGARMQDMFEQDLAGSVTIDAGAWRRRPWWRRTAERAASWLAPAL